MRKCPSGLAILGSTNWSIKEGEDGKWSQQRKLQGKPQDWSGSMSSRTENVN